jgi:acetyltransferase
MPDLNPFFSPTSIAVVGGSERAESMGGLVLRNLKQSCFEGEVYAINLKGYERVHGFPCVRYLKDVRSAIDLAVICVPPNAIASVLRQMGKLHMKAAIILTGGLARQLSLGQQNHSRLAQLAAESGIRVMGPNCLGVMVPESHLNATYSHIEALPGSVAYIGHSAALGTALLDWAGAKGIGFSHFLTLGASVDIRISDVVDFLATDRRVKAILIHLEQIRDSNRLLTALRAASKSKKVLAIRTHSQKCPPNGIIDVQKVDSEYFSRAGVLQVDSIDSLFSGLEILSRSKPIHHRNLAIVSNGLGTALLAKQHLENRGGRLATISVAKERVMDKIWYQNETQGNPAILPPRATGLEYVELIKTLEKEPELGAILVIHSPNLRSRSVDIYPDLLSHTKKSRRLILTCFLGGLTTEDARKAYDGRGLLNFDFPSDAVNAYLTLAQHTEAQERLRETPSSDALGFIPDRAEAKRVIGQADQAGRSYLTWPEARQLLRSYGFKLVDSTFDTSFERCVERLSARYFPAAIRIVHETYSYPFAYQNIPAARWRGAKIEIPDEAALRAAQAELKAEKERRLPDSRILGWAVQPMRRKVDALQFSIGITRDQTYGPLIFIGEGGSHADMLADREVALVPLNSALARQLIERTHGYQVLLERSDNLSQDVQALIRHLIALSQMVIDCPELSGVEVNLLLQNGSSPLVLGVAVALGKPMLPALNPYPVELEEMYQAFDGKEFLIRPIRGEDEPLLKVFFAGFDAESLRLRFFHSRLKFEHLELAYMSQIDYKREMVFVAMAGARILGKMRLWLDINTASIEFAVMVLPEAQGMGLASKLMSKAIEYAKQIRARTIVADVLPENTSMLALAGKFEFEIHRDDDLMKVIKHL